MAPTTRLKELSKLLKAHDPVAVVNSLSGDVDDYFRIAKRDEDKARVLSFFAFSFYKAGDGKKAFPLFSRAYEITGDVQALINAVIVSREMNNGDDVQAVIKTAMSVAEAMNNSDARAELYDVLCHCLGKAGDSKLAAQFGTKSLEIKAALQKSGVELVARKRPIFDFMDRKKNVISFSLFGNLPRYTRTALENAMAVRYIYPGWSCRFYCDQSVPENVLGQLAATGAEVRLMQDLHDPIKNTGLFWRFLPASDPKVDFFLVRDVDSLINVREIVAVDEWLASDKDFHLMRDFYTHSELILAGMWGGVAGRIKNISADIKSYQNSFTANRAGVHNQDQLFLREQVWPAISTSVMQHDSVFNFKNSQDFPSFGTMEPVRHVGQNMAIFMKDVKEA